MTTRPSFIWILFVLFSALPAFAENSVEVKLFSQPCSLRGNIDTAVLKLIHSVSPDQVYPDYSFSGKKTFKDFADLARRSLDKIKNTAGVPPQLDSYRDRLAKRLEAQLTLFESLESARKQTGANFGSYVTEKTKKFFKSKSVHKFRDLISQYSLEKLATGKLPDAMEQILDAYNNAIEPDPEEIFHSAIKQMNVRYDCALEENSESGESDSDSGDP